MNSVIRRLHELRRTMSVGTGIKIGTHNGSFHCDEIFACFLLKTLPRYADAEIIRSVRELGSVVYGHASVCRLQNSRSEGVSRMPYGRRCRRRVRCGSATIRSSSEVGVVEGLVWRWTIC